MKRILALTAAIVLAVTLLAGCGAPTAETPSVTTTTTATTATTATTTATTVAATTTTATATTTTATVATTTIPVSTTVTTTTVPTTTTTVPPVMTLNGANIAEYVVVYDDEASDYAVRAANYVRDEIFLRTGERVALLTDAEAPEPYPYEILVGETDRPVSAALTAPVDTLEFALMAKDGHVALEGDRFVIAAAAYYFVETYISDKPVEKTVPAQKTVCSPIVQTPKNFIFLIGDGMGVNQTNLFTVYDAANLRYSDGESAFYGYKFPYQGFARTASLDGVTDSAAAGTALSTGYKTINGRIGQDPDKNDLPSLLELACSKNMATAVLSTEGPTGGTPAAFTVHVDDRRRTQLIEWHQTALKKDCGTLLGGPYDYYGSGDMKVLRLAVQSTLTTLDTNENGFFMMYEEAHVDKHCHNGNAEDAFRAVVRFNQAIALFMEYAFYHPDTVVLITADHETGGLTIEEDGTVSFSTENHTNTDVPLFAYGKGAEVFDGKTVENVQIPKTIAKWMGGTLAADTDDTYPPLN